jgi:hypothetical protein
MVDSFSRLACIDETISSLTVANVDVPDKRRLDHMLMLGFGSDKREQVTALSTETLT